ncbi:type VI secretion system Vgr family protein [Donghicola sp. XS_ASV15]|uniref:type VI secretion system Vgr family protein n=1 Tax=Donghicola sp. XS_ASV15 TaxID=3241295 RepID=UPI003516F3FA
MATSFAAFISIDGKDKLGADAFSGREQISSLPEYVIELSEVTAKIADYIGKPAEISLPPATNAAGIEPRTFAGIVTDVELLTDTGNALADRQRARLIVRPFLILLAYSSASVIYQNKSSVEILNDVLERNGMKRATLSVTATPPKRATCIQYNENDLSFVERLLAEDGLVYYFHDGSAGATMLVHDTDKPFPANKSGGVELTDPANADPNLFQAHRLGLGRQIVTGKVSLTSYDAAKAAQALGGPTDSTETKMTGTPTVVEYRADRGDGVKTDAKTFARQVQGAESRLSGSTDHPALFLGQALKLAKVADADMKGSYVVSHLEFAASGNGLSTTFRAAPKEAPYLPPHLPKPLIAGVHNALVVGGNDGEVACDAEGRVKVKFFWDQSKETKDTTGWISVAETYAGKGYGGQFTPRIGHEVLVSFLHGDPDCPVITGQIYNAKNKPPFAKANTTQTGYSTKLKGKPNELIFDDLQDKEKLTLNAAKDYELTVQDTATTTVTKDEKTTIKGEATRKVEKSWDVDITKDLTIDAQNITLTGKSKITLKVGSSSIELTSSGITIKGSKLTLDSTQLTAKGSAKFAISGGQGDVQATGPLNLKGAQLNAEGSVMAKLKGSAMASVEGGGMTQIKGALVKVN